MLRAELQFNVKRFRFGRFGWHVSKRGVQRWAASSCPQVARSGSRVGTT